MRQDLMELGNDQRYTFQGTFAHFGYKKTGGSDQWGEPFTAPTFMLLDVCVIVDGETKPVTNHLWMNFTSSFQKFGWFKDGDIIQFDGRVSGYTAFEKVDFRISHPSKVMAFRDEELIENDPILLDDKEMVKQIKSINFDFYFARDQIDDFFKIENYYRLREEWNGLTANILIDGEELTKSEYKERYKTHTSIIQLYNDLEAKKIEIDTVYRNYGEFVSCYELDEYLETYYGYESDYYYY